MDASAGVTQKEGHTGFLHISSSAGLALIFIARRIQPPALSLVDRDVYRISCTHELIFLHLLGMFF